MKSQSGKTLVFYTNTFGLIAHAHSDFEATMDSDLREKVQQAVKAWEETNKVNNEIFVLIDFEVYYIGPSSGITVSATAPSNDIEIEVIVIKDPVDFEDFLMSLGGEDDLEDLEYEDDDWLDD